MADILDAAQKQIDDAAKQLDEKTVGASPQNQPPTPPPGEPTSSGSPPPTSPPPTNPPAEPTPPALPKETSPAGTPVPEIKAPEPPPPWQAANQSLAETPPPPPAPSPPAGGPEEIPAKAEVVPETPSPEKPDMSVIDTLLSPSAEPAASPKPSEPARPPEEIKPASEEKVTPPPEIKKAKKTSKGALLAVLFFLFITVPLSVFYITQQRQLADLRGRAAEPYPPSCPAGWRYGARSPDAAEQACIGHCDPERDYSDWQCAPDGEIRQFGSFPDYSWCYRCTGGATGTPTSTPRPTGTGTPRPTGTGTPRPTGTPTPTEPPPGPQCKNIKIYKGGVQIDPATLQPGDQAQLAVKGDDNPTKGRFRVNGGDWQVTTEKNNNGEFVLDFTVPSGVTQFTIEAEVFKDDVWK